MHKFTVALDCDEVLNNLIEKTLELYNARHSTKLTLDSFTDYDFYKCLLFEEAEDLTAMFLEKELWDSLSPAPHSQWGVKTLIDKGYDVYVATATHHTNFPWKVDWIIKNFPLIDGKGDVRNNRQKAFSRSKINGKMVYFKYFHRDCRIFLFLPNIHLEIEDSTIFSKNSRKSSFPARNDW